MRDRCSRRGITAAMLGLAITGCTGEDPQPQSSRTPGPGPSPAERVRVLAADVLVVDGQHIRLTGAWAPQPIPDARCWAEALAAKQATAAVRQMVEQAANLEAAPSTVRDAYNRTVTRVRLDELDLSQSLIDAGLAAASERRFDWCAPISQGQTGAPTLRALMDFGRP
ncbi:nuclease [Phenylobacterium sp.]|uniref:nuclease n=1 Tax=Phenylobacterium sp. TaxID=1871053 RepID=UPI0035B141E5